MAIRKRERIPPTEQWQQLTLRLDTAGQRSYEAIRPVVVFGEPVAEQATATQIPPRTLFRYVARFELRRVTPTGPAVPRRLPPSLAPSPTEWPHRAGGVWAVRRQAQIPHDDRDQPVGDLRRAPTAAR